MAFKVVPFLIPDLPRSYSVHTPFFRNMKIYAVSIFRPAKNTLVTLTKNLKILPMLPLKHSVTNTVGEG